MKTDFNFVDPVFDEIFAAEQEKEFSKVIYFGTGVELMEANGKITKLEKNEIREEYLCFDSGAQVRIDRIISINGKPGPAYDEYNRYAEACLDCNVGGD